jgi:hypothetical protein
MEGEVGHKEEEISPFISLKNRSMNEVMFGKYLTMEGFVRVENVHIKGSLESI